MRKMSNLLFYTAIYIRLSREDGDKEESDSVNNQRKLLLDYIQSKEDFILQDIYIDDGYSGTNFERPEFRRLIKDIETGRINCVVVKDLSRFGRDYIDTGRYLERFFPERGIRFISLSDGIDSMKKAYDMMLPIKNIFNEQYARDISEKIQATVKVKQQSGEFIGAFASYGYKKSEADKNKLIIDEYPASIVKRIFNMYISGIGKQKIARILTEEGIVCPSEYKRQQGENYRNFNYKHSTYWTYSTINSILNKEIYIGNMVQHTKHQNMRGRQNKVDKKDWVIVKNTHEPIIDIETWNKVQRLLNRRTRELDLSTNQNIFAGFIRCGDCGAAMNKISWKRADGSKTISFYCGTYKRIGRKFCTPHTLPFHVLEQIVLDDLKQIISNIENIQELFENNQERLNADHQKGTRLQLKRQQEELSRIYKWKKNIYEDYKEKLITKEEYISYKADYIEKEEKIKKSIEQLEASVNVPKSEVESAWIERLLKYKEIQQLDRSIVVEMIDQIIVYENRKIQIYYNFSDDLKHIFENEITIRN